MIYLPTNVAKTQDVRWTVLFSLVIPAKRPRLENCRNPVLHHSLIMKARGDVYANKCCYNLGCAFIRYYFLR